LFKTPFNTGNSDGSSGVINNGIIAGAVVSIVVLVALLFLVIVRMRRSQKSKVESNKSNGIYFCELCVRPHYHVYSIDIHLFLKLNNIYYMRASATTCDRKLYAKSNALTCED